MPWLHPHCGPRPADSQTKVCASWKMAEGLHWQETGISWDCLPPLGLAVACTSCCLNSDRHCSLSSGAGERHRSRRTHFLSNKTRDSMGEIPRGLTLAHLESQPHKLQLRLWSLKEMLPISLPFPWSHQVLSGGPAFLSWIFRTTTRHCLYSTAPNRV